MDAVGGNLYDEVGRARTLLALVLVFVAVLYSGGVMMHRAEAFGLGSIGAADKASGEVRAGPRISWAAKQQPRTAMRPAPTDPPADNDPYLAAVEGIGIEFSADLQQLVANTRQVAIATLRDLHGDRHDLEASVDYMIGVALNDATLTTLRT